MPVDLIEERYRHDLERIQADLGAVLRRHAATEGWPIIVHALIETSGTLAALLVAEEPMTRGYLVSRLDDLSLHIATAGQRAQ
jgi:hypothetical protein